MDKGRSLLRRRVRQLRSQLGLAEAGPVAHPRAGGAAGTEKNFKWIARSADGWITTPRDFVIDEPVRMLQDIWAAAGRDGAPSIVALDFKPVPEKLEHWKSIGVTAEVLFGLPDNSSRRSPPTSSDWPARWPRWTESQALLTDRSTLPSVPTRSREVTTEVVAVNRTRSARNRS